MTSADVLRYQLIRWQFWSLELQFVLLVLLTWINVPGFAQSLQLKRQDYVRAAAAAVLAFSLAAFVAPETNRIYYDEHIYQNVGQNLTDLRLAQMCNEGNLEYGALQCMRGEYDKHPYAYPYLLSAIYRFTGAREPVAFAFNTVVAGLMAAVVFLTTIALTKDGRSAGYAALIMALIPEQLRWAHSASVEPSAALACAFAIMTAFAFVRERTTSTLLWMVTATVFAMQFRPESVLVGPIALMVVWLYAPQEIRTPRFWAGALIGVVLLAVHIGHFVSVGNDPWGTNGSRLSLQFFGEHLKTNGGFYLADARFPAVYSLLALCGLAMFRPRRAVVVPLVYFLLFWGVFLVFFAGSYNFGVNVRFSLLTYPPLAILAGVGAASLVEWLRAIRSRPAIGPGAFGVGVVALVAIQFSWDIPYVRSVGEEAWGARADVAFARLAAGQLPGIRSC